MLYSLTRFSYSRIPDHRHPEMTVRIYDLYFHFLGALHVNPLVPNSANFMPDNIYHRATRVLELVLEGKIRDYQVYFDLSMQRSLNTM